MLDGLTDGIPDNLAKMLESKDSFIINKENEIFTRIHVIDILNEFAFFLSDNGDPDTTPKKSLKSLTRLFRSFRPCFLL